MALFSILVASSLLSLVVPVWSSSTTSPGFGTITINNTHPHIVTATINNPPFNIWDSRVASDFSHFLDTLNTTSSTKVVIFDSAVPDFFVARFDLNAPSGTNITEVVHTSPSLIQRMTALPQIFISQIEGRTRGYGNEFILHTDLRFASLTTAVFGQIEVPLGVIPGAGGIEYLSALIGRAKALEYILTGNDISAQEAAQIGWINAAFSPHQLHHQVWTTAERIATFQGDVLGLAKQRINKATLPSEVDIEVDNDFFLQLVSTNNVTQELTKRFLELTKNETETTELELSSLLPGLYKDL